LKRKILYIEDNEQNLYLVSFILEKAGYEVFQEREGKKGIETAARVKPDLILLDILLPHMDGYQVAEFIRKKPGLSAVPIIAVTSYAMPGDREKALKAGCGGYIEKPINPDTFADEIRSFLPEGKGDQK
jgi:two-component system, cell cycle response regulator DivK